MGRTKPSNEAGPSEASPPATSRDYDLHGGEEVAAHEIAHWPEYHVMARNNENWHLFHGAHISDSWNEQNPERRVEDRQVLHFLHWVRGSGRLHSKESLTAMFRSWLHHTDPEDPHQTEPNDLAKIYSQKTDI